MDYSTIHKDYHQVQETRLDRICARIGMSDRDKNDFIELEDALNNDIVTEDWLREFHKMDVNYQRLLERILEGAKKVGEPGAQDRYQDFLEEKGIMGPLVFLGGWNMTLASLDKDSGEFSKVAEFYGFRTDDALED